MKSVWPHSFLRHCMMAKGPGFDSMLMASCLSMTSHDGVVPCIKKMPLAPGLSLKSFSLNASLCLLHVSMSFFWTHANAIVWCGVVALTETSLAPRLSMPSHDGKGKGPAFIKCFKPGAFL